MNIITLTDISLTPDINRQPVLKSINWTINKNDRWVLFGANGSGKSMLLELITGYRRPSSGSISRFGKPATGSDIRQIRKKIGYVSSNIRTQVFPRETVLDLIMSGHYATIGLYDKPDSLLRNNAEELLEHTGLIDRRNDFFSHLSDGEKQKILIARALINRPELLILDEPAATLDIASREDLLLTLSRLLDNHNGALIYVTHHIEEITPLFQQCLILQDGTVFKSGSISETISSESLSELFNLPLKVHCHNNRFFPMLKTEEEN
ncbi:MAG: ATP-binding cassette domain-containing protein [Spirochaetes bacterium]|jgi:iron complex transport system ATP-binding protein|nr:ATP-binding cassette domain-containing protein [Spirochaetota bacterium]